MRSLIIAVLTILSFTFFSAKQKPAEKYVCSPCGQECDKTVFTHPGTCPVCNMELVKASSVTFKNVAPSAICSYIKSHPKTVLLDVRTPQEFNDKSSMSLGTLKNAINVPVQELKIRLTDLAKYKNQEVLVYCSHSHRSPQAAYILTQNGFKNVVNLAGGMSEVESKDCLR